MNAPAVTRTAISITVAPVPAFSTSHGAVLLALGDFNKLIPAEGAVPDVVGLCKNVGAKAFMLVSCI